ncbi:hypothetical protein P7D31_11255 [Enterococcus dongliensis]|uniref:hypothetical protein n=1 Tax=Enterococcus dongliensis TaxID=2559925 RepID=UPI00288E043A|nr:hypothetical protein [Enterococcus dongliensis]MDT2640694.1 hypothetical protein [Enterococcus dongliensis]
MTDGIEALFFEKAIIQDDPQKQFELLKQADYYAKQNKNLPLKALIREKLTSN